MAIRPLIGIPMRIEAASDRFYLSRHYGEAVEAAGGLPVHISLIPNLDYIDTVVGGLDGVLMPGSDSDVDPLRYGQQPHQNLGDVHSVKDETDLLVIAAAEKRAIPLFGICFGMQVLNVSRGGTLIQDIPSQIPGAIQHQQGGPRDRPSHAVNLADGSRLRELGTSPDLIVNSHHHQGLEQIGTELTPVAWATDGLVEAVEDPRTDRFVMAVQWHPESGWREDPFSQRLFRLFVNEATKYAESKEISRTPASV
jgi:putative glutamine amidotransferase